VWSRRFLQNEVFCTDLHRSVPLKHICGRCVVLPVRDFLRTKPEGFADDDVFVCESRYNSKAKCFKKMKLYWNISERVKLVPRDAPLEPKRGMSVFKERTEKHKEEIEELEDERLPNVPWTNSDVNADSSGNVYYEQYTIPGPITLRRGDTVYVRSEQGKNLIAQIDKMWIGEE
jgi:protein polybromo-1